MWKWQLFPHLTKPLFAYLVPNGWHINTEGQIKDHIVLFFAIAWRALFSKLIRSRRKNKAQWTFTLTTKLSPYLIECPGLCSTTLGHKASAIRKSRHLTQNLFLGDWKGVKRRDEKAELEGLEDKLGVTVFMPGVHCVQYDSCSQIAWDTLTKRNRRHQCRWVRALATESNESSFTHIAFPDASVMCRSVSSPYFLQTRQAILLFPPLFPSYINALCCHSSLFFFLNSSFLKSKSHWARN